MLYIYLKALTQALRRNSFSCFLLFSLPPLLLVCYSLIVPNIYKSEAVLEFKLDGTEKSDFSGIASQLGGFASLAGINLDNDRNRLFIVLKVIQSRDFIYRFINDNNLKPMIMAAESWDVEFQKLRLDSSIYDDRKNKWLVRNAVGELSEPTDEETYQHIISNNYKVIRDKESGLISLLTYHQSPVFAQKLNELFVSAINSAIYERDINEINNKINNLKTMLHEEKNRLLKSTILHLIETKQHKLTLLNQGGEYVFQFIESPKVAEKKFLPKRIFYLIIGLFLGFVFVSLYALSKLEDVE